MLDMERFQHSSRSRRRERPLHRASGERKVAATNLRPRAGDDGEAGRLLMTDGARGEGNRLVSKRTTAAKMTLDGARGNNSPTDGNSFAFELSGGSSKKAKGTPIKMLIDEEMSREKEGGRPSPSVIARLMGLDALPMQHPGNKRKKESVACYPKASSEGYKDNYFSHDDHLSRLSTKGQEEFKDVFEVFDTTKVGKPKNWLVQNRSSSSKQSDKEMAFIRQKFMDAKRFSTDEKLQNSKEFSDALEVLDSNKDLFLKFLQEPSSLFTKHLQDLQPVPATPQTSHIMLSKSVDVAKSKHNEIFWKSEVKVDRFNQKQKDVLHKYETDLINHSIKEHSVSLSRKLPKSKSEGKTEACSLPTRIVVLKPSLEKAQMIARVPSAAERFRLDDRRHREFRRSGSRELFSEVRERQKSSDMEVVRHKAKGSREIAKEFTEHMRYTVTSGSEYLSGKGRSRHCRHENSRSMSGKATLLDTETLRRTYGHSDDWNTSFSSSPSYSSETSVSREARKHLSERWMMTHKIQELGLAGQGMSTLGEMLALSDRETPHLPLDSLTSQKGSDEEVAEKEALMRWGSPYCISSRDGWKDGCSRSLPRSKSLPASSTIYGSPKLISRDGAGRTDNCFTLKDVLNFGAAKPSDGNFFNKRLHTSHRNRKVGRNKSQHSNPVGEENKHPVQEIHVNPDELQNRGYLRNFSGKPLISESSANSNTDTRYPVNSITVASCVDADMPSTTEEQLQQSLVAILPVEDEDFGVNDEKVMKTKDTSPNHMLSESLPSHCDAMESANSFISKEPERPSPVSILEPLEEDESSSECFERVGADLQELRIQLQLLKLESSDTYTEDLVIMSDEDAGGECDTLPRTGEIPQTFRDEEDRDFTYLVNILTDSGLHSADMNSIFAACYSSEFPVCPDVFEKLEKMYTQIAWPSRERKLLFDLINSVLSEILAPSIDLHPWVKPRRARPVWQPNGLAEEVWQFLIRQWKEVSGDPADKVFEKDMRWLDLGDDIDAIGRDIERMLKDDLLEEVVSEIISQ